MSDRDLFIDYRLRVVRIGLVLTWVGLAALITYAVVNSRVSRPGVASALGVLLLAFVLLTLAPWGRAFESGLADALILLWCTLGILGLITLESLRDSAPLGIGFLAVVIFAATALVTPLMLGAAVALSLAGYLVALLLWSSATLGATAVLLAAFLVASLLVLLLAQGIKSQLATASNQLHDLASRERELQDKEMELGQLYDVSRTIGAGSNLAEVLPELVGRVVAAVGAKVGLVLLYRAEHDRLEVMSPIWVAGHTVRAEGTAVSLTDESLAQRVFISGDGALDNAVGAKRKRDPLIADLDPSRLAAVPLRVESRAIGVLIVADKEKDFTREDLDTLESLAAPAALVLNQTRRYEKAREAGERMAELAQLKTDFVSVVSHELRTPLTSIIGSLKTLQRRELAPADPNALDLIFTAEKQAHRLRNLIEDLLLVSRLDNMALPIRPDRLGARSFLYEVVAGIPDAAGKVSVAVNPDVARLEADPDHLARILTNLIENAIRYGEDSPIEVTAQNAGKEVWIEVIDHGPGIPYELHDLVFDRFTQVERHETRGVGGTGLGLSIVRGLAEAMGGRVWFEPTIGGGATFTVALPQADRPSLDQTEPATEVG